MPPKLGQLRAEGAVFAYNHRAVVDGVHLLIRPGESVALAGPNGSGKTTLLRLLAGDLKPNRGTVTLDGRPVHDIGPGERSRRIAVVPQHVDPRLAFTVEEMVGMGRAPYTGLFGTLSSADRSAVTDALAAADVTVLAGRRFDELSGGEQQRVVLAMALAQETRFLLLDEPTVHLDLQHQYEMLELLRRLRRERDVGTLAVMHDLNLAALYFDRLAVMSGGRLVADGPAHEVLVRRDSLNVFNAPLSVVAHPSANVPQVLLRPGEDAG